MQPIPFCKWLSFIHHEWGEWAYESNTSCRKLRSCRRCGETEQKVPEHAWSEPQYIRERDCARVRICRRCGENLSEGALHLWVDWQYVRSDSCLQERTCSKCGIKETQADNHQWGPLETDNSGHWTTCTRCNHYEFEKHDFHCSGSPYNDQSGICRCQSCGYTEWYDLAGNLIEQG